MAANNSNRDGKSNRGLANASPKTRTDVARKGGLARAKQMRGDNS